MRKNIVLVGALLIVGTTSVFSQQEKQIEEVTIASKTKQQLYKTGKSVKLLTQKDLEAYKGQNLNEVLERVAGFQIVGNFNNSQEPKSMKIRGGKSANVLILMDGIPLKDITGNDYSVSDLRWLALENIDSIEVLNGASSVLYGSNATVSVINIKTKKASQKAIEGTIGARLGSFSTFAQNALLKGKINQWNYQVSGSNEKSEGLSSALGENFDKDGFEKQNVSALVGYTGKNWNVNVNGGYNHFVYDFDNDSFQDGKNRGNDHQYFVGAKANWDYKNGSLVYQNRFSGTDRTSRLVTYDTQYQYKGENFFHELYSQNSWNTWLNSVIGIQFESQKMGSSETNLTTKKETISLKKEDTGIQNVDVFANLNFTIQNFHLDLGGRMNHHSKYKENFVYSINPYYLHEFNDWFGKIGFSHATAFIAPTIYQTFGNAYIIPNFELKPETNQSNELDFAFGKKDRSFVFNANFFQRKEKNAFQYVSLPTFMGQFQNIAENSIKGFETSIDYQFNPKIRVGGNFSFVEIENEKSRLRQPKQRANAYVDLQLFKGNRIHLNYQFVARRSDFYYQGWTRKDVTNPDFSLVGLNINQKFNKNVEAYVNINNILDRKYVDVIGYTTKPINFSFGMNYNF